MLSSSLDELCSSESSVDKVAQDQARGHGLSQGLAMLDVTEDQTVAFHSEDSWNKYYRNDDATLAENQLHSDQVAFFSL